MPAPLESLVEHHRGGVEHDDHHQPAQHLERHVLNDEGSEEDRGNSADGNAERDLEVDVADRARGASPAPAIVTAPPVAMIGKASFGSSPIRLSMTRLGA